MTPNTAVCELTYSRGHRVRMEFQSLVAAIQYGRNRLALDDVVEVVCWEEQTQRTWGFLRAGNARLAYDGARD